MVINPSPARICRRIGGRIWLKIIDFWLDHVPSQRSLCSSRAGGWLARNLNTNLCVGVCRIISAAKSNLFEDEKCLAIRLCE